MNITIILTLSLIAYLSYYSYVFNLKENSRWTGWLHEASKFDRFMYYLLIARRAER